MARQTRTTIPRTYSKLAKKPRWGSRLLVCTLQYIRGCGVGGSFGGEAFVPLHGWLLEESEGNVTGVALKRERST